MIERCRSNLGWLTTLVVVTSAWLLPASTPAGADTVASTCTLAPTAGTVPHDIDGREYLLHVPAGITGASARLLVTLHGLGATPGAHESVSGLSNFSDQYKVIVAYPLGTYPAWNGVMFTNGWNYFERSSADVDFLRAVVADISATYCVNPAWVHADGISMGGEMSQRLACDASDVFASVSGLATNDVSRAWFDLAPIPEPCTLPRPTSVYLSCGDADFITGFGCPAARNSWAARLSCPAPTTPPSPFGQFQDFRPCNGGSMLWWRTWAGIGHEYPTAGPMRDRWFLELAVFFGINPRP